MKILMLTPYLPYPLHSGGQIRSYYLIKYLSQKNEITLFSFIRNDDEKKYLPELQKFCKTVKVFKRRPAWSPINILLSGFTFYPFLVCIYLSNSLRKAISQYIKSENFDLIHVETFYVVPNIPKTNIPIILVEQTIEFAVYKHYADITKFALFKPLLDYDVLKIKYWESHYWQKARSVVAVSDSDKKVMLNINPNLQIGIVPNGIDANWFKGHQYQQKHPPTILYVGNFKWLQNVEAVQHLRLHVWPAIKKAVKNARLLIVGRGMDSRIYTLKDRDVEINEKIDDVRQAFQNADLLVAPIKGPGGTRLKILEAMASELPVVSTSVGVEGLNVKNSQEVFIENNFSRMSKIVISLLNNNQKAKKVAIKGKEFVNKNFSWQAISRQLEKIYYESSH